MSAKKSRGGVCGQVTFVGLSLYSLQEGRVKGKARKTLFWTLGILVIALVGLRLALPGIVQRYVNNKLDELPEYDGHIGDVDIHLLRGAYSIDDVDIVKTTGAVPVPFVEAATIDFSVQWRELFHGALVGEIQANRARLNLVKGKSEEDSQTSIDDSWLDVVKDLFPFRINKFEIRDSEIWFRDFHSKPQVDIYLTNLVMLATNLYNTRDLTTELPADIRAIGTTLGEGEVELQVKLDPLAEKPEFDLELALRGMDLVALNELLEAYGNFNVKRGTFELFTEIAASEGRFDGYAKPFFENLDVFELDEDSKNPLKMAWQAVVAGAVKLFKNHPRDQVATKIPISGSFQKTEVSIWTAVLNVLRNAFVEAFSPKIDDTIDLYERSKESKAKEAPEEQNDKRRREGNTSG